MANKEVEIKLKFMDPESANLVYDAFHTEMEETFKKVAETGNIEHISILSGRLVEAIDESLFSGYKTGMEDAGESKVIQMPSPKKKGDGLVN